MQLFGLETASRQLSFEIFSVQTNSTNSVIFLLYMIGSYMEMVLLLKLQASCLMIIFAILAILDNHIRWSGKGDGII